MTEKLIGDICIETNNVGGAQQKHAIFSSEGFRGIPLLESTLRQSLSLYCARSLATHSWINHEDVILGREDDE